MAEFKLNENGDIVYVEPPEEEIPLDVENSGTQENIETGENSGSLFEPTEENLNEGSEDNANVSDEILNQGDIATDSLQEFIRFLSYVCIFH